MPKRLFVMLAVAAGLAVGLAGQTSAPAAPRRHPASPAEAAALKTVTTDFNDPSSSPDVLDAAIGTFRQQFPTSAYTVPVLLIAVRYARANDDYLRLLEYGTQVLALEPHNLYTLASLGAAIPDNVKQTDLDMDQRLSQAEDYDQQVIAVVGPLMATDAGLNFQGIHYSQAQTKMLKDNLEGPAYLSLGRVATLRQKYDAAVAAFRQAISFEPTPEMQAQAYYDIGEAEADAHHVPEAQAAFAKTLALAPNSDFLKHMVEIEQAKLKPASDH